MKNLSKKGHNYFLIGGAALIAISLGIFLYRKFKSSSSDSMPTPDTKNNSKVGLGGGGAKHADLNENGLYPLHLHSKGVEVSKLQSLLNSKFNAGLVVDGDFGVKTLAAVKKFLNVDSVTVEMIGKINEPSATTKALNMDAFFPLKMGDKNQYVKNLQMFLVKLYGANTVPINGEYGMQTASAVMANYKVNSVSLAQYLKIGRDSQVVGG